jgi:hypothetical protein
VAADFSGVGGNDTIRKETKKNEEYGLGFLSTRPADVRFCG